MSRILIVNGSPRKDGVDSAVASMVGEEFSGKGHEVETIDVCGLKIGGCRACMACKRTGRCAQDDDMQSLYPKVRDSDMLILMSPVYFGAETAQMKAFIDRLFALTDDERPLGKVRMSSILLVCGDPDGAMVYGAQLSRLCNAMKYLKVEDFGSGCIIGGLKPEDVRDSPKVRDYMDSIDFQLGL